MKDPKNIFYWILIGIILILVFSYFFDFKISNAKDLRKTVENRFSEKTVILNITYEELYERFKGFSNLESTIESEARIKCDNKCSITYTDMVESKYYYSEKEEFKDNHLVCYCELR